MEAERQFLQGLAAVADKRGHAYGEFNINGFWHVCASVDRTKNDTLTYRINKNMYTADFETALLLLKGVVSGRTSPEAV